MKYSLQKIPLLISIILFVFLCFGFWFLYRTIDDNNKKANEGTITLQADARRRDEITSLDRSLQEIKSDRALLDSHFAQSSDAVPFLDTIEQLGSKAGGVAEIDSVTPDVNNTGLIVELKASGNFESVYKFLTLLENSPYELDFLSMNMDTVAGAPDENAKSSAWEAVFKIRLLSFIQETN